MIALRIGLLTVDGITLEEVSPARDRLVELGMQVTLIIPSGGSILPVTGRYFPAAGGVGVRRSLSQISPSDFHLLLLPDSLTQEKLMHYPEVMAFLQGHTAQESGELCSQSIIVFQISYLMRLLDRGTKFDGMADSCESVLSGS